MKLLKAKLYDMERERVDSARASERKSLVGSGDRSERIRTYNFPQGRVTDHRINLTLYKLDRIISGDDLGEIVDALVTQDQADRLAAMEAGRVSDPCSATRRAPVRKPASTTRAGCAAALGPRPAMSKPDALLVARRWSPPPDIFESLIARRIAREPLAYITGHKEFWSLDFAVGPGVLIPRPDTETLIEELLRTFPDRQAPLSILDLGTGSGCLLIAALSEYPNAHGVGIDQSPDALAWARRNVAAHRLEDRATLIESGWLEEASPGFDILLANPPYIPAATSPPWNPTSPAMNRPPPSMAGPTGWTPTAPWRPESAGLLKPGGHAFLEIGAGQARPLQHSGGKGII